MGAIKVSYGITWTNSDLVKINDSTYSLHLQEQVTSNGNGRIPQSAWRPTIDLTGLPGVANTNNLTADDGCAPVVWQVVRR